MSPRPAETPPPLAPAREMVWPVRVRYCESDPMGFAHHSAYAAWFEEARTELCRTAGMSYAELEAQGALLAVIRLETSFRRPARYDDRLAIGVRVVGGSRVKIRHEYEVRLTERAGLSPDQLETLRQTGDDLLATATTTLACIGPDGRPRGLPEWLVPPRG